MDEPSFMHILLIFFWQNLKLKDKLVLLLLLLLFNNINMTRLFIFSAIKIIFFSKDRSHLG